MPAVRSKKLYGIDSSLSLMIISPSLRIIAYCTLLAMCIASPALGTPPAYSSSDEVDILIQILQHGDDRGRLMAAEDLGNLNDTRAVDPLILALKDPNKDVRSVAARVLGDMRDPRAVEPIISALKDENFNVRSEAALSLIWLNDSRALDPLILALKDDSAYVRMYATTALGKLRDRKAVDPLIQSLNDVYDGVRRGAVDALAEICKYDAGLLLEPLRDEDSVVRANAALVLGYLEDVRALEPLISALNDSNSDVRRSAAIALGNLKDIRALEPLIPALSDNSSDVRRSAAFALGNLNDSRAVDPLIQALDGKDSDVRAAAASSLGNMKNKSAVDPLIAALSDNSSDVRLKSAEALGKINDKRASDPLIRALNDTDQNVRSEAMKSLVDWVKVYGGPKDDGINAGQQTSDGGFVLLGYTSSFGAGEEDVWLLRADSSGTELWNRTFGGSGWDDGIDLIETEDGDFVIVGGTESFGSGERDLWLIKADSEGKEVWNRTFGGPGEELGGSVKMTEDGGYIIAGINSNNSSGNGDLWLLKTDSVGEELWNRTFRGAGRDEGFSVLSAGDGYLVAGYSYPDRSSPGKLWLLKTDLSGDRLWTRDLGISSHCEGTASSAVLADDGGWIISGGKDRDAWLLKTNSSGREEWNSTLKLNGGSGESCGLSVKQSKDGGYLLGGYTGSGIEYYRIGWFFDSKAFVARADAKGSWIWSTIVDFNALGAQRHLSSRVSLVDETADGGFILVGGSEEIGASIYSDSYLDWSVKGKSSFEGDMYDPDYSGWDAWLIKLKSGNYSASVSGEYLKNLYQ
jgi:HEAT repeat protein